MPPVAVVVAGIAIARIRAAGLRNAAKADVDRRVHPNLDRPARNR